MIRWRSRHGWGHDLQFNLTPMIDVVFLLIIFFMLACQFIAQENYQIVIPDDCPNAMIPEQRDAPLVTVSVLREARPHETGTTLVYAVRSQRLENGEVAYRHPQQRREKLIGAITEQLRQKSNSSLCLRADRDLAYEDVQEALLALAQAGVQQVQLAAYRDEHTPDSREKRP